MDTNSILETLTGKAGQFVKASWVSTVKGSAAHKADTLTKEVSTVVRTGITYDNREVVKEGRENGTLPAENAGLSWGVWAIFPYLIQHKGADYIRLYPAEGHYPTVAYKVNGETVTKAEFAEFLTPSAAATLMDGDAETPLCFTVKAAGIVGMG